MRIFLCASLLFCLPLFQARAADTTIIAAFGDSLTAGFGIATEDAFPAQLERKLLAGGYHVQIINDGVSGDTTAGGVSRIDSVLAQKPNIVILELGANDMLRGFPPEETRTNLSLIIGKLKDAKIKLVVAGMKASLSMGPQFMHSYNDLFCDLASSAGAKCYPFFLQDVYGHPDLVQSDGMHPTKEGVAVIVNGIYPLVTRLLTK